MIIGIDPGQKGGLALLDHKTAAILDCLPMPATIPEIHSVLNEWSLRSVMGFDRAAHVFVEQVGAMPKQGVTSMFTFGRHLGNLEGILVAIKTPYEFVRPQVWQKTFWGASTDSKTSALQACQRLYPQQGLLATVRSKKAHDGLVDAILIARWGWQQMAR